MEQNSHSKRCLIKKILLITILVSLIGTGIQTLSDKNFYYFSASAQQETWVLSLRITESSGRGTTVVLKTSPDASDGQDNLDIPIPPPPLPAYVRAWFTTPFPAPYNSLLNESKYSLSTRVQWNLSVIWVPELENNSLTTIDITWNPAQIKQSPFNSFQLLENNSVIANMLTESSYSFPSNGTVHHFQIIGQTIPKNNTSGQNDLPIFPITLGIIVLVITVVIALFWYKRKK